MNHVESNFSVLNMQGPLTSEKSNHPKRNFGVLTWKNAAPARLPEDVACITCCNWSSVKTSGSETYTICSLNPINNANLAPLASILLNQNISGQPTAADPFIRPHRPVTKMGICAETLEDLIVSHKSSHKSPEAEACALKSQARASDFAKRKLCLVWLKKTLDFFQVIEIPQSYELHKRCRYEW